MENMNMQAQDAMLTDEVRQPDKTTSGESDRRHYKDKRFAIPSDAPFLNQREEKSMVYPDVRLAVTTRDGQSGEWRVVKSIETYAERIAQLYREGIYEIIDHPEYEWHTKPSCVIEKDRNGTAKMYALFLEGDAPQDIIQALSVSLLHSHRICWGLWTTVDPAVRGLGVMKYLGRILSLIGEHSGCDLVKGFVVTTHALSQRSLEEAGFLPVGYFPGGELFTGADGRCYRHNVIWYQKMFPRGLERTMTRDYERLLGGGLGAKIARAIQEIWDEALQDKASGRTEYKV